MRQENVLSGVLLHMVTPACGIHAAVDLSSRRKRRGGEVQDASIFLVRDFANGDLLAFSGQDAKIVNLAAAGRIKRGAVEHDGRPSIAVERFDHASVKVVKKRIVIVEAISWRHSLISYFKSRPFCGPDDFQLKLNYFAGHTDRTNPP